MQELSTIAIVAAIISTSVSATVTFIVSYLIEWFVWFEGSKAHTLKLSFKESERFLKLRWGINYVRDGREEVVANLSEREKWFVRLRNKVIYLRGNREKKVKIRFYRTLGFQFKCFVELDDPKLFNDLKEFLGRNKYSELSRRKQIPVKRPFRKSKTVERIWFIHNDTERYTTLKTSEDIVNNFFYPE